MRKIRRLSDLRMRGTAAEQDFVRYLVASQLERHPREATDRDWAQAWFNAEDWWEQTVRDFDDTLGGNDLHQAEERSRRQLLRVAYARLHHLGWA